MTVEACAYTPYMWIEKIVLASGSDAKTSSASARMTFVQSCPQFGASTTIACSYPMSRRRPIAADVSAPQRVLVAASLPNGSLPMLTMTKSSVPASVGYRSSQ